MIKNVIIVTILVLYSVYCQFIPYPNNPCPSVFQYVMNNEGVLGYLEFPNDYSGYYELSVNTSAAARLASNKNIRLELRTSAQDLVNGKPAVYFIHFPIQNVLPKPTRVVFNKKLFCSGPPENLQPGGSVTNMWASTYFRVATSVTTPKPGLQFFFQFGAQPTTQQPFFTLPARPKPEILNVDEETIASVDSNTVDANSVYPVSPNHAPTVTPFTNPPIEQCGYAKTVAQNLMVNGNGVTDGEFPWLVAIMYRENFDYRYRCAGSLISKQHVITAGHCVRYYQALLFPIEDFLFVLGKTNIQNWASGAVIRDAENITVHPNYQQNKGDYDIAIIKLNKDVEFAPNIQPLCIWQEDDTLDKVVGQRGVVAGWGRDENENSFVPDAKSVSIPIVSQVECLRSDPGFASLTSPRTFCAGNRDGTGPCTGDSGGGFFMSRSGRWTLRGVISQSLGDSGTCDTTKYFVFVDAAKLADWITATVA